MSDDPRGTLRRWLPHVLMIVAIVASIWLLAEVVAPLFEPILLAAALAMLTYPVLHDPVQRVVARLLPFVDTPLRGRIAGIASTVLLVSVLLTPFALLVLNSVDSLQDAARLALGVLQNSAASLNDLQTKVAERAKEIGELYPQLKLDPDPLAERLMAALKEALHLGPSFLSFIFEGTGAVAQIALAFISLAFFYVEGPRLARALLGYSPLDAEQQATLLHNHRRTVLRLLSDTVATAVVKGIVLGLIVWGLDRLVGAGRLPFLPIALVAGVLSLLPLVGVAMVWLPFAGLLWTTNRPGAIALAAACWLANLAIDHARDRVGRRLDDHSSWRSFLLFLGLVGGLLSYGLKGLVIGPMAVVLVTTVCSAWLPLYGGSDDDAGTA